MNKTEEQPVEIEMQVHPDRDLYRYVGPHGPSKPSSSLHDITKLVKWVYGDVKINQRLVDFEV